MRVYNEQELEELIICPKKIIEPPRKEMRLEKSSLRNNFELESIADKTRFSVFMRKNERFPENFSIGLVVYPKDESGGLVLLRYNGPHGEHVNNLFDLHPHYGFHIHKTKAENIEKGFLPERYAELTKDYGSYEEALTCFLKKINIKDAYQYFDVERYKRLWDFPLAGGNNELS